MRIAHISDLHFFAPRFGLADLFSKRIVGQLNALSHRKGQFLFYPLSFLPETLALHRVDLLIVSGDLTTTGLSSEFLLAKRFLSECQVPYHVIPGNHDRYVASDDTFYAHFPNEALQKKSVSCHPLDEHLSLLLLDTASPRPWTESTGLFTPAAESHFKEAITSLPSSKAIAVNHFPFFKAPQKKHSLLGHEKLRALFENNPRLPLYLHGHTHRNAMADLRPNHLPLVLDAGSLSLRQGGSFHLLEISQAKTAVTHFGWSDEKRWHPKRREEYARLV